MNFRIIKFLFIAMIATAVLAPNCFASGSGGFRVELPGAEASGKGSAFVGEADNPSAVYFNPAGLTQLKGKNYISSGFSIISPSASHTDFAGNETQMPRQNFKVPHLYLVSDFGIDDWVFGVGGTSNWGTATDWADDSFSRYVATQSDLVIIDSMITASYMLNEQWSLGFGVNNVYSTVNRSKKLLQTGGADGDFNLKGDDTGWGYRLAGHFKLNEHHKFGLMYRSRIQLKYRGKAFLHELNGSGSNFAAIFGGDHFETAATSELELPQSVVMGYSYQPEGRWLFNFDIEWMGWNSVEQDLVEYPEVLTALQGVVLNSGNPAPADWTDAWSASVGTEYAWSDNLRLRTGAFFNMTPIPDENFNSNLPDANVHGFTSGFGYDINDNMTIDLFYGLQIYENRTIDSPFVGSTIDGTYEQIMHLGAATLTYGF